MKSFSISEDLKNIIEISCDVAQRAQLREVSPLCLLVAMLATSKVKRLLTSWEINAEALLLEASDALRRRVEMQKALAAYEPKHDETRKRPISCASPHLRRAARAKAPQEWSISS